MIIDVQDGLMRKDGRELEALEATRIAQRAGLKCSARFAAKYEGRQVYIGGASEVLSTRKTPKPGLSHRSGFNKSPASVRRDRIKPFSPKRASLESIYREQKKVWHPKHQRCEFVDPESGAQCRKRSSARPHHKKKRGRFLTDTTTWMGICEHPHHARIHENERWAYQHGFLIKTTEAERRGPPIITPLEDIR